MPCAVAAPTTAASCPLFEFGFGFVGLEGLLDAYYFIGISSADLFCLNLDLSD